ncbi:MAG: hypothetical protein M5T61_15790 [Acidimicrobiia bacterium]|nr:hypothetical protein [Acidimicrobiia bacterium]
MSSPKRRKPRPRRKGPTPPNRASAESAQSAVPDHGRREANRRPAEPATSPVGSGRYTPKLKNRGPFRPTWHKVVGALMVLAGLTVFVLNDLAWFDVRVMPGGHNELYAVVAVVIAASSLWWFGAFDRPPERR